MALRLVGIGIQPHRFLAVLFPPSTIAAATAGARSSASNSSSSWHSIRTLPRALWRTFGALYPKADLPDGTRVSFRTARREDPDEAARLGQYVLVEPRHSTIRQPLHVLSHSRS